MQLSNGFFQIKELVLIMRMMHFEIYSQDGKSFKKSYNSTFITKYIHITTLLIKIIYNLDSFSRKLLLL